MKQYLISIIGGILFAFLIVGLFFGAVYQQQITEERLSMINE